MKKSILQLRNYLFSSKLFKSAALLLAGLSLSVSAWGGTYYIDYSAVNNGFVVPWIQTQQSNNVSFSLNTPAPGVMTITHTFSNSDSGKLKFYFAWADGGFSHVEKISLSDIGSYDCIKILKKGENTNSGAAAESAGLIQFCNYGGSSATEPTIRIGKKPTTNETSATINLQLADWGCADVDKVKVYYTTNGTTPTTGSSFWEINVSPAKTSNTNFDVVKSSLADGTYTIKVSAHNSAGYGALSDQAQFTIVQSCNAPVKQTLTKTTETVCAGSAVSFSIASSETGVNYQLYNGSDVAIGASMPGTGSAIAFTAPSAESTSYYVKATAECGVHPSTNTDAIAVTALTQPSLVATFASCGYPSVAINVKTSAAFTATVANDGWGIEVYSDETLQNLVTTVTGGAALTTTNKKLQTASSLSCNTFYWVRAFATSACGTVYSSTLKVHTKPRIASATATDITCNSAVLGVSAQATNCPGNAVTAYTRAFISIGTVDADNTDTIRVIAAQTPAFRQPFSVPVSGTITNYNGTKTITLQPNTTYYYRAAYEFYYVDVTGKSATSKTEIYASRTSFTTAAASITATTVPTFPAVEIGGTGEWQDFEFTFCGYSPAVADVVLGGTNASEFELSNVAVSSGSITGKVRFKRASAGEKTATISVTGTGGTMTLSVCEPPVFTVASNTSKSNLQIKADVTVTSAGGCGAITAFGVQYSVNSDMSNATKRAGSTPVVGTKQTISMSNLNPNTKYYYRAYATINGADYYSETIYDFTKPEATASYSDLTATSVRITGKALTGGGFFTNTDGGVYLQLTPDNWTTKISHQLSNSSNVFNTDYYYDFSGLTPNTTYQYRFVAYVNDGVHSRISFNSDGSASFTTPCATLDAGVVTGQAASVCSGSGQWMSNTGYSGTDVTYEWEVSDDGTNWSKALNQTHTLHTGTLTSDKYYRVQATDICSNVDYTEATMVTVDEAPVAGTISGAADICSGSTIELTAKNYTGTLQWQKSATEAGTYTDISGATNKKYTTDALTTETWYKVKVSGGACGDVYTPAVQVGIMNIPAAPGAISGDAAVCQGAEKTYSVADVATAECYIWEVPGDWGWVEEQCSTNSITVTVGSTSGNVTVSTKNACGTNATPATKAVTVTSTPVITLEGVGAKSASATYPWEYMTITATVSPSGTVTWTKEYNGTGAEPESAITVDGNTYKIKAAQTEHENTDKFTIKANLTGGDCPASQKTYDVYINAADEEVCD